MMKTNILEENIITFEQLTKIKQESRAQDEIDIQNGSIPENGFIPTDACRKAKIKSIGKRFARKDFY